MESKAGSNSMFYRASYRKAASHFSGRTLGCDTERENLAGDAKGKGTSGENRKAESTDAPERGGLPRSSDEAAVMVVEQRGQVIAVDLGQPVRREEPFVQRKAAAFARLHEPDESRGSSPESVRGSG